MSLEEKIEKALDTIRPYLEADGGNVKLVNVSDGKEVALELQGACVSCPMSAMTMKAGVEQAIKNAVPEITVVKAVNQMSESAQ